MTAPNRRRFVTGTIAAAAAAGSGLATATAAASPSSHPLVVEPADPRYADLAVRGSNKRFTARPEAFVLATTTEQVVVAVREAVRDGKRIAVRSGGHCYENFVGDTSVRRVVDLAGMDTVRWDAARGAFEIGAGARLVDVYRALYYGWGVTVPGGASATVAFGGHVQGGGYGALSRRHGISSDHLLAVEVVVVDARGRARAVVATRDANDPNRELWWAHTGAGGGNFGVVTRYWFRSPAARGSDPATALPRPHGSVLTSAVMFPREGMTRNAFRTLVGNHGRWHERNSGPRSPYTGLFSGLVLLGHQGESDQGLSAVAFTHLDATLPDAGRLLQDHIDAVSAGVGVQAYAAPPETLPWLASVESLAASQDAESGRQKIKSSYLRRAFTDEQIDVLYGFLGSTEHTNDSSSVSIQSYGGLVNTVGPRSTASWQRGSVMKALFMNTWQSPERDAANVDWLRRLYAGVYQDTGGVPAPNDRNEGCFINFPDIDMADPKWNTSGVPWHRLYFGDNYHRLQAVKAKWDPREVFHHPLSVRAAR
ncbi:FAD-binding protein [Streptomyces sp. NBC_00659]|uniref:FAD-dependent oxidoreductase n=1 Tax=Streptomyces sp. NBC_00659 TaxID=2903669 RepID=UPI002E358B4C|nr:FAD-binding protein [Streptomyces sp. NBC_00659]